MLKIILIFFVLISFSSCNIKKEQIIKLEEVRLDDIFYIEENKYLVLFYSKTCIACINTLEVLNKRMEKRKYKGFCVNINNEDINYSEDFKSNIGVNDYREMTFNLVPYLVYIEEQKVIKEVTGYTNIHKENLYIFFE